jgi:hypothetical protein
LKRKKLLFSVTAERKVLAAISLSVLLKIPPRLVQGVFDGQNLDVLPPFGVNLNYYKLCRTRLGHAVIRGKGREALNTSSVKRQYTHKIVGLNGDLQLSTLDRATVNNIFLA